VGEVEGMWGRLKGYGGDDVWFKWVDFKLGI